MTTITVLVPRTVKLTAKQVSTLTKAHMEKWGTTPDEVGYYCLVEQAIEDDVLTDIPEGWGVINEENGYSF